MDITRETTTGGSGVLAGLSHPLRVIVQLWLLTVAEAMSDPAEEVINAEIL